MKTLDDWTKATNGWPVNFAKDDTDGLKAAEYVIYDGTSVSKSATLGGDKSSWGSITSSTTSSVIGKTSSGLYFRITCPSGTLNGELSTTSLASLAHHRKGVHVLRADPIPPGSWTAAEGSGQFHRSRGEREKGEELKPRGAQREREALQV